MTFPGCFGTLPALNELVPMIISYYLTAKGQRSDKI